MLMTCVHGGQQKQATQVCVFECIARRREGCQWCVSLSWLLRSSSPSRSEGSMLITCARVHKKGDTDTCAGTSVHC
jgi:hypothetical protein